MSPYRILSLDGGGIKGVVPAAFLASLEEELDGPIGEYFDLIVGTSTGGILALGLGLGFRASELLKFYEDLGPKIFDGNGILRMIRQVGLEKWSPKPLRTALARKFGKRRLGDSKARLVIPTLNLDTGEVYVYKTAHHPRFEKDYKTPAVEVALATAAAPAYFPPQRSGSGIPLVDGGMWANNPVGFAAVEAVGVLNWPREELRILSLGCTSDPLHVKLGWRLGMGGLFWARKITEVFMAGQSSSSIGVAQLLAGHGHLYRYNPRVPGGRFALDGVSEIPSLKGLGFSEARKAVPTLRPIFFSSKAEAFTPFKQIPAKKP